MELFGEQVTIGTAFFLLLALGLALSFEFVNGFHDTANAVATVIYTNTLKPVPSVIWSGIWNLLGVLFSSGLVAFSIVSLLPVELVLHVGSSAGYAMVFSLLISAIIWNVGTWYIGLPASSSHTLIGSILGVGLANSLIAEHVFGKGVNWHKAQEVGLSLLISPIIGFVFAALLLLVLKFLVKAPSLYKAPEGKTPPPWWIRIILMVTCTGVSFAHGSNDGQKGMGLIVLILVGILPGAFALRMSATEAELKTLAKTASAAIVAMVPHSQNVSVPEDEADEILSAYLKPDGKLTPDVYAAFVSLNGVVTKEFHELETLKNIPTEDRSRLRTHIYLLDETIAKLDKGGHLQDAALQAQLKDYKKQMDGFTKFIPDWVKYAVGLALGLGTMIGWKRIVVTVGEKIGKEHLTYAQGASAEMVAMTTIGIADHMGLPVSTTHVLSSGIAGTMAANRSGLQMQTLRNILMAWILTLPACIFLGAALFAGFLFTTLWFAGLK